MSKPVFSELFGSKREAEDVSRRLERKGYRVTVSCVKPAGQKSDGWLVEAY